MSKNQPIVLIEDDEDDKDLFESVVRELEIKNEIKWFAETKSAFDYLSSTEEIVYLIFCDINLPGQNGIEFKREIEKHTLVRKKSIPFLFYSTSARAEHVNEAYTEMIVQGFFRKENSYAKMKEMLKTIFHYWSLSKHPNSIE